MEKTLIWLLDKDTEQASSVKKLEDENRELKCELDIMKFDASYDSDGMKARLESVKSQKNKYMVKALDLEAELAAAQRKINDLEG